MQARVKLPSGKPDNGAQTEEDYLLQCMEKVKIEEKESKAV
jgi:hypothetical protein